MHLAADGAAACTGSKRFWEQSITDWHNARDVSLEHGHFGFDDYISHLIRFLETMTRRAYYCRGSTVRRSAGVGERHGTSRQPGAAAVNDPDGRSDRHARQPDQGQHARQIEIHRLVRTAFDRARLIVTAAAADWCIRALFSLLRS
jgi:hypothetical protein